MDRFCLPCLFALFILELNKIVAMHRLAAVRKATFLISISNE